MPRVRKLGKVRRTWLRKQVEYLRSPWNDVDDPRKLFATQAELVACWASIRDAIMDPDGRFCERFPGSRPMGWWHVDSPIDIPDAEESRPLVVVLHSAGLLTVREIVRVRNLISLDMRRRWYCNRLMGFVPSSALPPELRPVKGREHDGNAGCSESA